MKKLLFLSGVIVSFLGLAVFVSASSPFDITFPIPELANCENEEQCRAYCDDFSHKSECIAFARSHGLATDEDVERIGELPEVGPGGCQSESECRAYCDDSSNVEECLDFAEEHNLIEEEELDRIRELIEDGPGGCKGPNECRAYCEDLVHQDECFEFAEEHGLIPPEELERARAILQEGGPGGCKSESECRAYCQDPTHTEECVDSAVKLGFLSEEEATRIKKAAVLGGPGGCKGEECRDYCEDPAHQAECIEFAEENGFMSPEDAARARKFAGKTGPGGCKGEECRTFCESPEHGQVCLEFAEREGLIPPEEATRARKFLAVAEQGGPGGCRGIECRDYCEDSSHQDECFAFAKGNGLLRPEDEQNFEVGRKLQEVVKESGGPGGCKNDQECRAFCTDASHVEECVAFGATHGGIPESQVRDMLRQFTEQRFEKPGEFRPHEDFRRFEEESRARFEEFRQLEEQFRGPGTSGLPAGKAGFPGAKGFPQVPGFEQQQGVPSSGEFAGPGGCTSPSECIKYCTEHKEDCFSFGPPGQPGATPGEGGIPPGREFDKGRSQFRPQLQQNLIREFRPEEIQALPEFQNEEQKREFFKEKFEEFHGVPESSFPPAAGEGIFCTQEYAPVCGVDGRTYPSRCVAEQQNRVQVAHEGKCTTSDIPQNGIVCTQEYDPVCGQNGRTYSNACMAKISGVGVAHRGECTAANLPIGDSRAAACAGEGGVWDGSTCRAPAASGEFFPETGSLPGQTFQQTQEQVQQQVQQQTERQVQQQILEQQIQQQQQQLQEQLKLLQQQTSPQQISPPPTFTPPPTSTGGNILDAAGNLLKRFFGR